MSTSRATKKEKSQKQKTGVGSHPLRSRLMESTASGSLLRCSKKLKRKENQELFTDTKTWWSRLENTELETQTQEWIQSNREEGLAQEETLFPLCSDVQRSEDLSNPQKEATRTTWQGETTHQITLQLLQENKGTQILGAKVTQLHTVTLDHRMVRQDGRGSGVAASQGHTHTHTSQIPGKRSSTLTKIIPLRCREEQKREKRWWWSDILCAVKLTLLRSPIITN